MRKGRLNTFNFKHIIREATLTPFVTHNKCKIYLSYDVTLFHKM
jgi:hypothetical protein